MHHHSVGNLTQGFKHACLELHRCNDSPSPSSHIPCLNFPGQALEFCALPESGDQQVLWTDAGPHRNSPGEFAHLLFLLYSVTCPNPGPDTHTHKHLCAHACVPSSLSLHPAPPISKGTPRPHPSPLLHPAFCPDANLQVTRVNLLPCAPYWFVALVQQLDTNRVDIH